MFTKYPVAGFAKTRLIPRLGPEGAAEVSRRLSERCMSSVREYVTSLTNIASVFVRIFYTGKNTNSATMEKWLGREENESFIPQCEGDLGSRMMDAFENSIAQGATKTVAIGTDIPEISANVLRSAFSQLNECDVVVGPAVDGGYYLLGMCSVQKVLFHNIPWSTEHVLDQTKKRAIDATLVLRELGVLRDIDLPEDLEHLSKFVDIPIDNAS